MTIQRKLHLKTLAKTANPIFRFYEYLVAAGGRLPFLPREGPVAQADSEWVRVTRLGSNESIIQWSLGGFEQSGRDVPLSGIADFGTITQEQAVSWADNLSTLSVDDENFNGFNEWFLNLDPDVSRWEEGLIGEVEYEYNFSRQLMLYAKQQSLGLSSALYDSERVIFDILRDIRHAPNAAHSPFREIVRTAFPIGVLYDHMYEQVTDAFMAMGDVVNALAEYFRTDQITMEGIERNAHQPERSLPQRLAILNRAVASLLTPRQLQAVLDDANRNEDTRPPPEFYYNTAYRHPYIAENETATVLELVDNLYNPGDQEDPYHNRGLDPREPPDLSLVEPAQVDPEYTHYLKTYEEGIESFESDRYIPNLYIYSLAVTSKAFAALPDLNTYLYPEGWQGDSMLGQQLGRQYSSVVDPGQLTMQQPPYFRSWWRKASVSKYLNEYAATHYPLLGVPALQHLRMSNYCLTVPSNELSLIDRYNDNKEMFPFHIEIKFHMETSQLARQLEQSGLSSVYLDNIQQKFINGDIRYGVERPVRSIKTSYLEDGSEHISQEAERPIYESDLDRLLSRPVQDRIIENNMLIRTGLGVVPNQSYGEGPTAQSLANIRSSIENDATAATAGPINRLMEGGFSESQDQVVAYRLVKKNREGNTIQNMLFGADQRSRMLSYIDTQVRYATTYQYELSAFYVVYGTEYSVTTLNSVMPEWMESIYYSELGLGDAGHRGRRLRSAADQRYSEDDMLGFTFHVQTRPWLRMVEVPIYTDIFDYIGTAGDIALTGRGIRYMNPYILDNPPCPPDLTIYPYRRNSRQVMFSIRAGIGRYRIPPIPIEENDTWGQLMFYQENFEDFFLNKSLTPDEEPQLIFSNEGTSEISKAIIYRTTEIDDGDPYGSFFQGENPYAYEISSLAQTGVFFSLETMDPNVVYYYTVVLEDVHGHFSNPSIIYQIRLVDDNGMYYPEIEPYVPNPRRLASPSKKMARYLQIRAADIQTQPHTTIVGDDSVASSTQSPLQAPSADGGNAGERLGIGSVYEKPFLIRLTSKDTGRKFDIGVTFRKQQDKPIDDPGDEGLDDLGNLDQI